MKKCIQLMLVAVVMMFSFSALAAEDEVFTRYIQKGDKGEDVIMLQKVLNTDPETKVAEAGPGSPGNEVDNYGELTKQAVIKFQKKHTLGTQYGFFTIYSGALDDKTRAFLNKFVKEKDLLSTLKTTSASSTSDVICDTKIDDGGLASRLNPFRTFSNMNERVQAVGSILDPSRIGQSSVEEKLQAINILFQTQRLAASTTPFIRSVTMKTEGDNPFTSFTTFTSGGTMIIKGCNFATSTDNIVHMMYNDIKVKSKDTRTLEFKPKIGIESLFNNGFTQALDNFKDPVTRAIEKELREQTLKKMLGGMLYGKSDDSDAINCKDDSRDSDISNIIKDNIKDPKKLAEAMEKYKKEEDKKKDNKEKNEKDCDEFNKNAAASSTSAQQLPGSPVFITVENDKGISNGYQFYFDMK